jgi:hypothetical protein
MINVPPEFDARRLLVGVDKDRGKVVLGIAGGGAKLTVSLRPAQARDMCKRIEDICERLEPNDSGRVIVLPT